VCAVTGAARWDLAEHLIQYRPNKQRWS